MSKGIIAILAAGQLRHQQMNRERLREIMNITASSNQMLGFDSYVLGALGPLILAMADAYEGEEPLDLEPIYDRIITLCRQIVEVKKEAVQ